MAAGRCVGVCVCVAFVCCCLRAFVSWVAFRVWVGFGCCSPRAVVFYVLCFVSVLLCLAVAVGACVGALPHLADPSPRNHFSIEKDGATHEAPLNCAE